MAAVPLDQRVRRAGVLWRHTADKVLIRRRGRDDLVVLAGTGAELWDALAEPATVADLAAVLAARHDAAVDVVAADIAAALAELVAADVVDAS